MALKRKAEEIEDDNAKMPPPPPMRNSANSVSASEEENKRILDQIEASTSKSRGFGKIRDSSGSGMHTIDSDEEDEYESAKKVDALTADDLKRTFARDELDDEDDVEFDFDPNEVRL